MSDAIVRSELGALVKVADALGDAGEGRVADDAAVAERARAKFHAPLQPGERVAGGEDVGRRGHGVVEPSERGLRRVRGAGGEALVGAVGGTEVRVAHGLHGVTGTGSHDAGRFATFDGETTWTPSAQPRPGSSVIATWSPSTFALVTRKLAKTLAGTANTPDPIVTRAIVSRQRTSMSPAAFQSASSSTRPCWCRTRVSLPAGSKPHLEKSPFMVVILR